MGCTLCSHRESSGAMGKNWPEQLSCMGVHASEKFELRSEFCWLWVASGWFYLPTYSSISGPSLGAAYVGLGDSCSASAFGRPRFQSRGMGAVHLQALRQPRRVTNLFWLPSQPPQKNCTRWMEGPGSEGWVPDRSSPAPAGHQDQDMQRHPHAPGALAPRRGRMHDAGALSPSSSARAPGGVQ
ncbi:hypothetical protein ABPG77_002611 [Micractinium sp. CCAP 211/92]